MHTTATAYRLPGSGRSQIGLKLSLLPAVLLFCVCSGLAAKSPIPDTELVFTVQPSPDDTTLFVSKNSSIELRCAAKYTRNTSLDVDRIKYRWLRNGVRFGAGKSHNATEEGTLRLGRKMADGHFRCVADGQMDGGADGFNGVAIVSRAVHVQPVDFHPVPSASIELIAYVGGSVLIVCPFFSQPRANVSWWFGSRSEPPSGNYTKVDENNNRFIPLTNGSLLIVHVRESDNQRYRCLAQNLRASVKPERTSTTLLRVLPNIPNQSDTLLPPMQNQTIVLKIGASIDLLCAGRLYTNVSWTAIRNGKTAHVSSENILRLRNVTANDEATFNCSTTNDYQVFHLVVAQRPVITEAPQSLRGVIGSHQKMKCIASGHPKPTISWYRNGELLRQDLNVRMNETHLCINSYDNKLNGVYQCVAENAAGEAQATAMITWTMSINLEPVTDLRCYPYNNTHFLVGFEAENKINHILAYTASEHSRDQWLSELSVEPSPVPGKYLIRNVRAHMEVFTLFVRYLETTEHKHGSSVEEMSPLSVGVRCAGQGIKLSAIVQPSEMFVWWPEAFGLTLSHLTIEFQQLDATRLPPRFTSEIVGSRSRSIDNSTWSEIKSKLAHIPVSRSADQDTSQRNVTTLQVPGYVTGILIPNANQVRMRVIVPVIDVDTGSELVLDNQFIQWTTIPSRLVNYHTEVGVDSISFLMSGPSVISCLRLCYENDGTKVQCVVLDNKEFKIGELWPDTPYQVIGYECGTNFQVVQFEGSTKPKVVPEPVTNIEIRRGFPIVMEWTASERTRNGAAPAAYFAIQWTNGSETYSANVSADSRSFEFPDTTPGDLLNISIRSMGHSGAGIPVYYDMTFEQQTLQPNVHSPHTIQYDPTLGILIGVVLSVICILASLGIIVTHRRHVKRRQTNSPDATSTSPNNSRSPVAKNGGAFDMHEMETLIHKPMPVPNYQVLDRISVSPAAASVGDARQNGGTIAVSATNVMTAPNPPEGPGEGSSDGKYGFILSSTPKREHSDDPPSLVISGGAGNSTQKHSDEVAFAKPLPSNNNELPMFSQPRNGIRHLDLDISEINESCCRLLPDRQLPSNASATDGVLDESVESTADDGVDLIRYSRKPLNTWSFQRPLVGPNG